MLRRFAISVGLACLTLSATARTRPHYGGSLRIETQGDGWQMPDGMARRLVLDTLTTTSDTGSVQPALAVRWESQNAAHRWEFWIRPGVHFQDGETLTPDAVAAALTEVCGHGAAGKCPWRMVRGVGASVVFVSDSPVPDLPALLAQMQFAIARQGANGAVIGTGPYRVTGFTNGALTLAANDDCWSGRPFADGIELRTRRLVKDQWLDLSVGKADIVEVPPELLRQAQQQHMNVLVSRPVDLLALTIAPSGVFASREMTPGGGTDRRSDGPVQRDFSEAGRDNGESAAAGAQRIFVFVFDRQGFGSSAGSARRGHELACAAGQRGYKRDHAGSGGAAGAEPS